MVKKHYVKKGYTFTKRNEPFIVKAEDLADTCGKHVRVICDECGIEFSTPYKRHVDRVKSGAKDLCRSCAANFGYSYSKDERRAVQFKRLYSACEKYGYTLLTKEDEYTSARMDIKFICPKHGEQIMPMYNLQHGCQCIKCSYELRGYNCRHNPDYVEQIINSYNNNKLLNKHDYSGANVHNLKVLCGKCGVHTFITSFGDYVGNNQIQCRSCSSIESSGEKIIADYLTSLNIEFVREKKFEDCRDKKPLPFDFYIPEYNLIIEFDGKHHFEQVWSEKHFEYTTRHDKIKNAYCYANRISLLRIPYWDGHNIPEIIDNKLNEIIQVKDIV